MGKQKKYIKRAFIALLKEQSIHKISVNSLTKKADVSRSCFYTYYSDKFELLDEIELELITKFTHIMKGLRNKSADYFFNCIEDSHYPIYDTYFHYIEEHRDILSVLLSPTSETNFTFRFMTAIAKTRKETLLYWNISIKDDPFDTFNENLLASSYVSTFKTWLDNDCQPNATKMGHYLSSLWRPGFFYSDEQYQEAIKYNLNKKRTR